MRYLRVRVTPAGRSRGTPADEEDAAHARVVDLELVVVDLGGLVDLAERHVELDEQHVLAGRGVALERAQQLRGARPRVEALVHQELGAALEEQLLDLEPGHVVVAGRLVALVDRVRDLHLELARVALGHGRELR